MKPMKFLAVCLSLLALPLASVAAENDEGAGPITYSKHVASILNQKCVRCHRPGQGTPMTLGSYEEVRPWARSIARLVKEGTMPPWHAVASIGPITNDRSLEEKQVATIVRWVEQGSLEGDAADLPQSPTFSDSEWVLGEPDFVVTLPEVFVPGGGPDQFENLSGKVMLPEDRWIGAVEILPGNKKVVHHVIAFQIKGFNVDPEQGWLGAWAAGSEPMTFPPGTARVMTKGANLVGDMHYHPAETDETDITRIGFHFLDDAEVDKELANIWVMNTGFEIPPGAPDHEVRASYRFAQSGKLFGFAPHMHYRGKDFTFTATYPDGSEDVLLRVENYDFNWQTMYTLDQPIEVPEGTLIECVAHFDNSADNVLNPDPTKTLHFGDESYDEMMIGFMDFVVDDGVRMETTDQTKARYLKRMIEEHPNEVYVFADSKGAPTSLHLPPQGEGLLYLRVNRNLTPCRIFDIEWEGSSFSASVDVPGFKVLDLEGTADARSFSAKLRTGEDSALDFEGSPAAVWRAEKEAGNSSSGL